MKIPYVNLDKQYYQEKKWLVKIFNEVLSSGIYIGGDHVEKFEKNISRYCNTKYCVSLNSGTDALTLALHALGVRRGDEVITTPNSFIASTAAIVHLGAKPVFVDVLDDQNINPDLIEDKITKNTKVIMPVHLTGRVCQMDKILKIAKKYNIKIIEDAAQSIGSLYKNKKAGSLSDIGCFSAHPLKNLNAIGDGGYLTTNSKKIYDYIKRLRSHGMIDRNIVKSFGYVSRMDNLKAAILNFRIRNLNKIISTRRKNAQLYKNFIKTNHVYIPEEKKNEFNTYHTFVIQVPKRDILKEYLKKNGIETSIHYPIPIHLQPASKKLGFKKGDFPKTEIQAKKILTLPINQHLTLKQIKFISKKINNFFN
jgi:dTDP-4-amino-4,6-dideoxygalactose transaminase